MQNVLRDFQKKYNIKSDHFLSHFPTRNSQIWHLKIISWRLARKNKENVHLRFFIFETSSQRFLSNMLRDFQKSWNYKKHENGQFSRPIFHQKQSDIASKKYFMTISMEKQRKCTSHIYYFWNFITEIFAKHVGRFPNNMKLWKIGKLPIF